MEIKDVGLAVRLYYEKVELNNKDIQMLFGVSSSATVAALKDKVLRVMAERNTPRYNLRGINTDVAYEVWGLDVASMERRYRKLKKLGFVQEEETA